MKPKAPQEAPANDSESDAEDVVPETQGRHPSKTSKNDDDAGEFTGEQPDSEGESDYSNASHTPKRRKSQPKQAPQPVTKPAVQDAGAKEGLVKKAARKISASAHANFRKLKIKNKNSKAKGRFGRGRR